MDLIIFIKKGFEVYASKRLKQEAQKLNLKSETICYEDIGLGFNKNKVDFSYHGKPLPVPKMAIFRVAGKGTKGEHFVPQRTLLLEEWQKQQVEMLNSRTYLKDPRLNKMVQHARFCRFDIPFVPSQVFSSLEPLKRAQFKFPLIVKGRYGSGGQRVFKADSPLELRNLLAEDPTDMLIQPFLPTGVDYRVIVLGGKALGAMRKTAPKGEFLTNVVRGGIAKEAPLTDDLRLIAEKAANVFEADYVGVDIMYDEKGNPFVLEVNRGAQFEGFEKSTGMNVAAKIVKYLLDKNQSK